MRKKKFQRLRNTGALDNYYKQIESARGIINKLEEIPKKKSFLQKLFGGENK